MERAFEGNDAIAKRNKFKKKEPESFLMPKLIPYAITPKLNLKKKTKMYTEV